MSAWSSRFSSSRSRHFINTAERSVAVRDWTLDALLGAVPDREVSVEYYPHGDVREPADIRVNYLPDSGLAPYLDEWRRWDAFMDQAVVLHGQDYSVHGTAAGIDMNGALILECGGELRRYAYGDVSLRGALSA